MHHRAVDRAVRGSSGANGFGCYWDDFTGRNSVLLFAIERPGVSSEGRADAGDCLEGDGAKSYQASGRDRLNFSRYQKLLNQPTCSKRTVAKWDAFIS